MTVEGVAGFERSCIRPGLWMVEGHQVKRIDRRGPRNSGSSSGTRWIILPYKGGTSISNSTYPTFRLALEALYNHMGERGCQCP